MQESLDKYVSQLLSEKGVPETPESHAAIIEQIDEVVNQALVDSLPIEQLDKLQQAVEAKTVDDDLFSSLLREANINVDEITNSALSKFRNDYLKGAENE